MQPKYTNQTPLNEEVSYDHDECGDRRGRLYVKRIRQGWIYHCFNCEESGFKRCVLTPKETQAMLEGKEETKQKAFYIPEGLIEEISPIGQYWYESFGITQEEASEFEFRYWPKENRLILPVIEDGKWVFWQGRYLGKADKKHPKYLSVSVPGKSIFFKRNMDSPIICVVEDILSAIKVGRTVGGLALLGSSIPLEIVPILKDKKIVVWLDQDKRLEAVKYSSRLFNVHGIEAVPFSTKLDPKAQSDQFICESIGGMFGC